MNSNTYRRARARLFSNPVSRVGTFIPAIGAALVAATGAAQADALTTPAMSGPLKANASPTTFDAGPLGKIFITGAISGIGVVQDNVSPGDRNSYVDFSNGQVFVLKTDGWLQFFVQAGAYSLPALGTPYLRAGTATNTFFGVVPQAFLKVAPTDDFSIIAGKLPTLIGAEYTFTFENMNIDRGLLWNQENAVNRGVQANYTMGPLTFALSWNDGFYSDRYNWLWGSVAYTIDPENSLSFIAGGNLGRTAFSSLAAPLAQNNSDIYNIIYTHTSVPWTINPYLQYTHVAADTKIGIAHSADTWGAALLVSYAFDDNWSLAGRVEYIDSNGSVANGAPSLIYGPGSNAWSLTLTPTYQKGIFFARADLSYVGAGSTTPGFALGPTFSDTSQARAALEVGVLF